MPVLVVDDESLRYMLRRPNIMASASESRDVLDYIKANKEGFWSRVTWEFKDNTEACLKAMVLERRELDRRWESVR